MGALIGCLVKEHSEEKRRFANVPRHNGFEAWRRIAEPINEDKLLLRKELLPRVTNPRHATSIDDLPKAMEEWETNKRLFVESNGTLPSEDSERLSLIEMLTD